jgi:hypothetical protein
MPGANASPVGPRLPFLIKELKAADGTDYADESSYDGYIRVIRVIRGSSCPETGRLAGLDYRICAEVGRLNPRIRPAMQSGRDPEWQL